MKKVLISIILLLFVFSLSSCTAGVLLYHSSSDTSMIVRWICMTIWALSVIWLLLYIFGRMDDSIYRHNFKQVKVDGGKWHDIETSEHVGFVPGTGSEERGVRWANNGLLTAIYIMLFLGQYLLFESWIGDVKNIVYVLIVGGILFELILIFDFLKRNIASIKYLLWTFCAVDFVVGSIIGVIKWLFS